MKPLLNPKPIKAFQETAQAAKVDASWADELWPLLCSRPVALGVGAFRLKVEGLRFRVSLRFRGLIRLRAKFGDSFRFGVVGS